MTQTFNPGDVVRSTDAADDNRGVGDVFEVLRVIPESCYNIERVCYTSLNGDGEVNGDARTFELIARAGEPVKFLPGDVVEVIRDFSEVVGPMGKGPHTVECLDRPGEAAWVVLKGHEGWGGLNPDRFKLVHRPEPAKEPLTLTPPAEPAKPQVGDRVRVTFEGKVESVDATANMVRSETTGALWYIGVDDGAQTEVITKRPLTVGDRVRSYRHHPEAGELMAMDETYAAVRTSKGWYTTWLDNLERVS